MFSQMAGDQICLIKAPLPPAARMQRHVGNQIPRRVIDELVRDNPLEHERGDRGCPCELALVLEAVNLFTDRPAEDKSGTDGPDSGRPVSAILTGEERFDARLATAVTDWPGDAPCRRSTAIA